LPAQYIRTMRVAILYTCFNRKDKTLSSLKHLYEALDNSKQHISISVYLTDDNSSDGTSKAVTSQFSEVKILKGDGELFWAGGMRNSWGEALKRDYDAYLLLNDDTETFSSLFNELLETHSYSIEKYGKGGIYIGSTKDKQTQKLSYGGAIFTNKIMAKYIKVIPNGQTPQECELGNANIMMVHKDVVSKIGILSKGYVHGLADFDYTLKAGKTDIPIIITPNYLGNCTNDHSDKYQKFSKLSLVKRWKMLHNPIGLDFKSQLIYMKNNFPYRFPFVFIMGYFKVLFPTIYVRRRLKN